MASVDGLLRLLECPVCMEVHRGKAILTCTNGHNVCQVCYEKPITTCPQCRISFKTSPPARNRLAESLMGDHVPFACSNSVLGCVFRDVEVGLAAHEAGCNRDGTGILAWTGKIKFMMNKITEVDASAFVKAVNGWLEVSLSHWPGNMFMWFTGKSGIETWGRSHATLQLSTEVGIVAQMRRWLSAVDGKGMGVIMVSLEEVVLVDFLESGGVFRMFPFRGGEPVVQTVRHRLQQHLHQDLHQELPFLDQEQLAQVVRQQIRQRQIEQEHIQRQESLEEQQQLEQQGLEEREQLEQRQIQQQPCCSHADEPPEKKSRDGEENAAEQEKEADAVEKDGGEKEKQPQIKVSFVKKGSKYSVKFK